MLKILPILLMLLFFLTGCKEADEGVEALSEKVTGKEQIEKGRSMEKEINSITNEHTNKQMEALKALEK